MKKLSLILVLAVIAVALVALMVACDPPGGETQQVYFNNAGSDIAKIYDAGTTTETVGALNSGERRKSVFEHYGLSRYRFRCRKWLYRSG